LDQPRVSRPGDLWELGRHRLLCGSALDPAGYGKYRDFQNTVAIERAWRAL
jgi:hypothetical protein